MTRGFYLLFSVVCYLFFLAAFLYLIGFVADLPQLPRTVNRGPDAPVALAVIADVALLALFGLQHSGMARTGFKRATAGLVPAPVERSLYVLASTLVLVLLFAGWRPIAHTIWQVQRPIVADAIWLLFALGWATVLLSTFLLSHFELFGLTQSWGHARGLTAAAPEFRTPLFYRFVRHPLYSGFILAFFAVPHMTAGHLLLAGGLTLYILVAIGFEERDLLALFGGRYRSYRDEVGMLAPRLRRTPR